MVLAMDVAGDCPADGHLAGPGSNRDKPTEGNEQLHQPFQADSRLYGNDSASDVHFQHAGHRSQVDDPTPRVLCRISVAAAQATSNSATVLRSVVECSPHICNIVHVEHVRPGAGSAAPSCE